MINRNNQYVSTSKAKVLEILKNKKRVLALVGGALVTLTLLSGCSTPRIKMKGEPTSSYNPEFKKVEICDVDVKDIDLGGYSLDSKRIKIHYTNLTDVSELSKYKDVQDIDLSNNLITDVSSLESLDNLTYLNLTNNSVDSFNIENYTNLKTLIIKGNYNLYTDQLMDYCETHDISVDITREDVKYVNQIRDIVKGLNIDSMSPADKEKVIFDYVLKHMNYDKSSLGTDLVLEYNNDELKYALQGKGVCTNYMALFEAMSQVAGIHNFRVNGYTKGDGHTWNLVEIDGQYMLCDPTWADQVFGKNFYYNKSGSAAKSFMKEHPEGELGGLTTFTQYDARSSVVKSSTAVKETNKVMEFIDDFSENLYEVAENADKDALMKIVLAGIAAGTVLTVSKKTKEKIDNYLKEKKEREKYKPKKEKPTIKKDNYVFETKKVKASVVEPKQDVIENEVKDMVAEQSPEVKTEINTPPVSVQQEPEDYLYEAVKEQIAIELHAQIINKYDKSMPEFISEAASELEMLVNMSNIERAVYRSNKQGYTNLPPNITTFEGLDSNTIEILQATMRMYGEVDRLLDEYKKQLIDNNVLDVEGERSSR